MALASTFGGGMGRLREVCGAVSGIFILVGLKYGYTSPTDKAAKTEHYKLVQDIADRFRQENGSIICRELLQRQAESFVPEDRTEAYYKERPCLLLVESAAKIAQDILESY
jgi:C_GCAxxG_C_C family probable redox protein